MSHPSPTKQSVTTVLKPGGSDVCKLRRRPSFPDVRLTRCQRRGPLAFEAELQVPGCTCPGEAPVSARQAPIKVSFTSRHQIQTSWSR